MGRRLSWLVLLAAVLTGCAPDRVGGDGSGSAQRPFAWTETPTLESIPDQPLSGMLGDQPFDIAAVVIEPGFHQWRIVCSATAPASPFDPLLEARKLVVELTGEPSPGAVQQRPMDWGGGYWQIEDPTQPPHLTLWNAANAWVIEFTAWKVARYDPAGPPEQAAGTASGRLAVVYRGADGLTDSWVAGTFTNAPVRYLGSPPWAAAQEPASP